MRHLVLALAATAAVGLAIPAANADTVIVKKHVPDVHAVVPPPPVVVHPREDSKTIIIKHHDND